MTDFVLSCEEVLVESAANDVSSNPELPPRPVLDNVCHDKLDDDDRTYLKKEERGRMGVRKRKGV